jgi:hypothetical protein
MKFTTAMGSICASLILTYPFDLASAKIMGDLNKRENRTYKGIMDALSKCPVSERSSRITRFFEYYRGFSGALLEAIPSGCINIIGAEIIYKYQINTLNKEDYYFTKYWKLYGCMMTVGLLNSIVVYPLDTLKRQYQVNQQPGYSSEFQNFKHAVNILRTDISKFYR